MSVIILHIKFVFKSFSVQNVCVTGSNAVPSGARGVPGKRFHIACPGFLGFLLGLSRRKQIFFFFLRQTNRKHIDGNVAIAHGVALTGRPRRPSVKSEAAGRAPATSEAPLEA